MKFAIEREKLLDLVNHAESVVEKRNTIPILSNMLFSAKGGRLTVTATDLDMAVHNSIKDVTIEREGSITVPTGTFTSLLKKLPANAMVNLEIVDGRIAIKAGRSSFKLPVLPADDFPLIDRPKIDPVQITTADLNRAFKMVRSSISTEETRYYLNGVCLAIENDKLVAVSTDGHRLSIAQIGDVELSEKNAIVPRKAVGELIKILDHYEGSVEVRLTAGKIDLQLGDLIITSKLIDGTFPDYTRVIPTDTNIDVRVCPKALGNAIDRVSVVSSEKTKAVVLEFAPTGISVSVNSPDNGRAEEDVAAECSGDLKVGYNSRYLKDILDNYSDAEAVLISMNAADAPAIIRIPGEGANRSVIMPMRV